MSFQLVNNNSKFCYFLLTSLGLLQNTMSMTKIPPVTRLSERIIRVLGCNPGPMTLQGTNSYIIGTGKSRILLDTTEANVAPRYVAELKQVLTQENVTLSHVILSHWHHDHVGALEHVLQFSRPDVWKFPHENDTFESQCLQHNQEFTIDGATLHVLHAPGHTSDHAVFYLKEENAVFSGDCILGEGTAVFEDLFDYMESLKAIQVLKPSVVYPGHGNVITDPCDRIAYYISHRDQRESQILDVLSRNSTETFSTMKLVETIYKETPVGLWKAAAVNVHHHLVKLVKENKVLRVQDDVWKWKDVVSKI